MARGGFGMIHAHYNYCTLYFNYYYTSSTLDHQALAPGGWGLLSQMILQPSICSFRSSPYYYKINLLKMFSPSYSPAWTIIMTPNFPLHQIQTYLQIQVYWSL